MMIEKNDWRLTDQMDYLFRKNLLHIPYEVYRQGWEHDHCVFCSDTFSLLDGDLHVGYCTTDKYNWICEECFNDFKGMFQWEVTI